MARRIAFLVALAASLGAAAPAFGCSCAQMDTKTKYDQASAAFIGTVESRRSSPGPQQVTYTYVVEESFKRDLGPRVEITTSVHDATCGYDAPVGARHAMVLHNQEGGYSSGICNFVDAEELRAASKGAPPPQPQPPVGPTPPPETRSLVLVAGRSGTARLRLLDGTGATVARGVGRGRTADLVACAGGTRMAELAVVGGRKRVVLRSLPSLAVLSSAPARPSARTVRCASGRAVASSRGRPDLRVPLPVARAAALCAGRS